MRSVDWVATSFTMTIAESAHALSQRHGKHLTLVGAIQSEKSSIVNIFNWQESSKTQDWARCMGIGARLVVLVRVWFVKDLALERRKRQKNTKRMRRF